MSLSLGQNVGGLVASYPLTKNDFNSVGGGNPKGEGGDRAEEDRGVQDPIIGRGRRGFEGVRWLGRSCKARMRGFPIAMLNLGLRLSWRPSASHSTRSRKFNFITLKIVLFWNLEFGEGESGLF